MLSAPVIGIASACGSALLGFWVVRYREVGPQTLPGAIAACVVAGGLLAAVGPVMRLVLAASGRPLALLTVADPVLAFAFWSGGVLIRSFLHGPAGGTHEPVKRRVRDDD